VRNGNLYLAKIAKAVREAVQIPHPVIGGCNVTNPIGELISIKQAWKFTTPTSHNRRGKTTFRIRVPVVITNGSSCGGRLKWWQSNLNRVQSHNFHIPKTVFDAADLQRDTFGYLICEIMEDGGAHDTPWIGCPSLGPFADFELASSLAMSLELFNHTRNHWIRHQLYHQPPGSGMVVQALQSQDIEPLIVKWRQAMLII
jgi:hypothetical protein